MIDDLDRIAILPELSMKAVADIKADLGAIDEGRKPWTIYGSYPVEHNDSYAGLVKPDFARWVETEIRDGNICNMFEVMGNGALLRYWKLPGLYAELVDSRNPNEREDDELRGIAGIFGHILDRSIVKMANNYLNTNRMLGFDLVVCRPAGGTAALGEAFKTHRLLITRLVHLLAVGGSLFYQPNSYRFDSRNEAMEREWFTALASVESVETYGLEAVVGLSSIKIKRLRQDVPRLPMINY